MALTFNGNNYLTKASAIVTDSLGVTFACWFNPSSLAVDAYLMGVTSATSGHSSNISMKFLSASTKVCCYASNDTGGTHDNTAASTTLVSSTSTWYHLCCVFTSHSNRTCYVNGGGAVNSVVSVTPATLDTSYIGKIQFNAILQPGAIGSIAFPAVWNVALTAADALSLYMGEGPLHYHPSHLISYARLTGGNSPEPDLMSATGWTLVAG